MGMPLLVVLPPSRLQLQSTPSKLQLLLLLLQSPQLCHLLDTPMVSMPSMFSELTLDTPLVCPMLPTHMLDTQSLLPQLSRPKPPPSSTQNSPRIKKTFCKIIMVLLKTPLIVRVNT